MVSASLLQTIRILPNQSLYKITAYISNAPKTLKTVVFAMLSMVIRLKVADCMVPEGIFAIHKATPLPY